MTENEIVSRVETLLTSSRKWAIISNVIWGLGLALGLFGIDKLGEMFSKVSDIDGKAFWFSCLLGGVLGFSLTAALGLVAQNFAVIYRMGIVYRGLHLLLKYHNERIGFDKKLSSKVQRSSAQDDEV